MPQKSLTTLYRRFSRESQLILSGFRVSSSLYGHAFACQVIQEMCVVRLYDAWERTCRELVMASACDEPVTLTGHTVHCSPLAQRRGAVLPALRSTFPHKKPPWWEPRWADSTEFLDVAQRLKLDNRSMLSLGMSITPSPAERLRRTRNFFAHRNQRTATEVAQVLRSYRPNESPSVHELLCSPLPGGTVLFESWILDLRTMLRTCVT